MIVTQAAEPRAIHLRDYRVPPFLIDRTVLRFELDDAETRVAAVLSIRRNPASEESNAPLLLDGEGLGLRRLAIDGRELAPAEYAYDGARLRIEGVPEHFEFASEVAIEPQNNTALSGLYRSRAMYCTQCEPEGFRRITFYIDRPDVLARFTTTVVGARAGYPVLLSNGNPVDAGELPDGRHFVTWEDPFPKPAYLFALVAGDLASVDDSFVTMSGRAVRLRIFVEAKDLDKCDFAMQSLKQAMRWDEEVYGREYDLDIFMIVAVDDFNMGAMENKGLNVFNTSAVLANPAITTDAGFQRIAAIVAHEYFHNWSGNRVTCRDWFQLSLKEGFTVFRDAEFSADHGSRAVRRIEEATLLRTSQFAEDAGPMAHPVRPDSYIEINNFYTLTVYEKGAEVVRMIRELIGAEAFRRGSDLYFARHDGQAVTCEDFVCAMEEASGRDLAQFRLWYSQAGTPLLRVHDEWDAATGTCRITVAQSLPPTPGQPHKLPMHIPLRLGLVGPDGDLPLMLAGDSQSRGTETVLDLTAAEQTFAFTGLTQRPVPSVLRRFSAPVRLEQDCADADLALLARADSDGFKRWDAAQTLAVRVLQRQIERVRQGAGVEPDALLLDCFRSLLVDERSDRAMLAQMLMLPGEAYLAELATVIDPQAIHRARHGSRVAIARALREELLACHARNATPGPYRTDGEDVARRSLRNVCLGYLVLDGDAGMQLALAQYRAQHNMSDVLSAFTSVLHFDASPGRAAAAELIGDFHARWRHEALAMNLWFQTQALRPGAATLADVQALRAHADYDVRNPNKVRALLGAYFNNPSAFHREDLAGYGFWLEQVRAIDAMNPQVAARLVTPLTRWRKYAEPWGEAMRAALAQLMAEPGLSRDSFEVVSKSLA